MSTKLRIKIGEIQFEYEGESQFSREDIKDLFSHMEAISPKTLEQIDAVPPPKKKENSTTPKAIHTTSIISRMGGKTATHIAIASAAHLQIVNSKGAFSRQELLQDMKTATTYYKETMNNNLTSTISRLIKTGIFLQRGTDSYSLSEGKYSEMEALIAG